MTVTLHGNKTPILSSACSALYAKCGLQAPSILYFLKFLYFWDFCYWLILRDEAALTRWMYSFLFKLSWNSFYFSIFGSMLKAWACFSADVFFSVLTWSHLMFDVTRHWLWNASSIFWISSWLRRSTLSSWLGTSLLIVSYLRSSEPLTLVVFSGVYEKSLAAES